MAVGGQLAEFSKAVPPVLHAVIADGMLLAQFAANKAAEPSDDVQQRYDNVEVLQNIGREIDDSELQRQQVAATNLDVNRAMIPVITAILGPALAAASIVVTVLEGLQQMDTSPSRITAERTITRGVPLQVLLGEHRGE